MPYVLISAPVYKRDWILPDWFAAIENQDFRMANIGFQFEAGTNDDETINCLLDFHAKHPEVRSFDIVINDLESHVSHPEGYRAWQKDRYAVMANFRNNLLARARCKEPDRFFSLDTDILLEDPTTISTLYQLSGSLDAVSPLCFMTPDNDAFPNCMTWAMSGHGMRKPEYPIGSVFQADVIMAAVMMSKNVYENTNYTYHPQGEDLGWSLDCTNKGFRLYLASMLYAPHIMSQGMLANYKRYGDSVKERQKYRDL